jgi:hypothetical protein
MSTSTSGSSAISSNVTRREAAKVSAGYAIAGGVMSFGFAKAEGSTIIKGAREMEIDRYRLTPSVLPGRPNISHAADLAILTSSVALRAGTCRPPD